MGRIHRHICLMRSLLCGNPPCLAIDIVDLPYVYGVDPSLLALLEKGLWWAPLMILIAALIHAVVSPSFRPQPTWRDR